MRKLLLPFCILLFSISATKAQNDCTVLLSTLQSTYEGDCKKGLANGKGYATGVNDKGGMNTYDGKFKNGLPHGEGKFTWANGDTYEGDWKDGMRHGEGILRSGSAPLEAKPMKAIWKNDTIFKEVLESKYKIVRQRNVSSISVKKVDEEKERVEIVLNQALQISNLTISHASGIQRDITQGRYVIDDPEYPLKLLVEYTCRDRLGNSINVLTDFLLESNGNWLISLRQ